MNNHKPHRKRIDAQMPKLTKEQLAQRIDMVVRKVQSQQGTKPGDDVIFVERGPLFRYRMKAIRVG